MIEMLLVVVIVIIIGALLPLAPKRTKDRG